MRRISDPDGRTWEVVLGRASWGAHAALFVPVGHDSPVRQRDLSAASMAEAMAQIDEMDDEALRKLLEEARIKDS